MSRNKNAQQVYRQFNSQLNSTIQDFYHLSHSSDHTTFKRRVLDSIRRLINCDSIYWATVVDINNPEISSLHVSSDNKTSTTNDSTSDAVINENATESMDPSIEFICSSFADCNLGETFIPITLISNHGNSEKHHKSNVSNIKCLSYPCHHLLVTIEKSPQLQLHDVFVLGRSEKHATFTEEERIMTQFLVPHILEAYRINLLHSRQINDFSTRTAVCDMTGNLLLADENFTLALLKLHPESKGKIIPGNVFKSLLENESLIYSRRKVIMKASVIDELMYIDFLEERRAGGMSTNERLVTKYMIQGLNHIEMAKQLKLPVSSILYIVNCVFKKLGIKNKAELNMKFSRTQANLVMAVTEM